VNITLPDADIEAAITKRLRKAISDGILFGVADEAEKLGRRKARKAGSA
jgi:hypothetical protein